MKRHLKRIASPKTWMIDRKENTYITKCSPGAHPLNISLPLVVVIRDLLKICQTTKEVKKLLNNKEVLVDGKKKKDHRLAVGLFDIISFKETKEHYRVLLNKKGKLTIQKIDAKESTVKPCKIIGKTMLSKNIQLNLHDGKNILAKKDFKCKVGDTVLVTLGDYKIKELIELKKDSYVYITKGKQAGDSGVLTEIKESRATYQKEKNQIKTLKKYLFVLGEKKSVITLENGK